MNIIKKIFPTTNNMENKIRIFGALSNMLHDDIY